MATKKVFQAKCYKCKDKEKVVNDKGMEFDLPYAYVEVPKDKDLLKECKKYAKESEEKYNNGRVIKRALLQQCPKCGNTLVVCCKDYADFYTPVKKEVKKEKEIEK